MRVAVCFFTHLFDLSIQRRHEKLERELSGLASVFILAAEGTPIPAAARARTCFFDFSRLRLKTAGVLGERLTPGSCHLAYLAFHEAHPGFDFYWFVEYDVDFSGDWSTLFRSIADDGSDLVAAHVRARRDEPEWFWWEKLHLPGWEDSNGWYRAFLPICRISGRGMAALSGRIREGWIGHQEAIVPCAILSAGLTLTDLGGDGPLTPEGRRHRFYVSVSLNDGEMLFGTLRAEPAHFLPRLARNVIYHPVKSRRLPNLRDLRRMRHRAARLFSERVALRWLKSYCSLIVAATKRGRES